MARPKSTNKASYYWDDTVLNPHILDYQCCVDDRRRDFIFETYLYEPLKKLCENVSHIKKFSYVLETHTDEDIQLMLLTQASQLLLKVDTTKGKTFAFFTVCLKRYLIQMNVSAHKQSKRASSIQGMSETNDIGEDELLCLVSKEPGPNYQEFIKEFIEYLQTKKNTICYKKRDEIVLCAVIDVLKDFDIMDELGVRTINNSVTFKGRNSIVNELRIRTNVKPQHTRHLLNRIRDQYFKFKKIQLQTD